MAEAKNVEEVDETKDPWDFEDPDVNEVVEETVPDKESAESTEESALNLPDELVERARSAGLTDDDLEQMGSADRLEFVLGLVEDKAPVARVESADSAANDSDATNEDTVDDNGDSSASSDDFTWIDKLDPDEAVDSDQARALKAMKSRMDELTRTMESMNTQTQNVKDNSYFSKLGEEWESLFGNSAATDYTPEQAGNRKASLKRWKCFGVDTKPQRSRFLMTYNCSIVLCTALSVIK